MPGHSGFHHDVFHDDDHVIRTLTRLLDDAAGSHRTLEPLMGLQDAQLPDGSRLHIVHRDLARGGHLMVNIRKFTGVAFSSLDELVDRNMLSTEAARLLRAVVGARLSMVIAGAPGSGKTTLLNCAAGHLDPSLRVVVAEEVFETDIPLANVASMQTRGGRGEREEVTLRQLVAGFLRMAPDVAIVVRFATRRRSRCCAPCHPGSRATPRSTPDQPVRHSPGCASSANWPRREPTCRSRH
jgi:pilus assembly protein CpaF